MAKQAVALRLDPAVLEWADSYAESRGVSRQSVLESAVASFRDDCEAGVPDVQERVAEVQRAARLAALKALQGVGDCPKRPGELGHVWGSHKDDPNRPCKFCGTPGRMPHDPLKDADDQGGHFAEATRARAELFSGLEQPKSVKVWGKQ